MVGETPEQREARHKAYHLDDNNYGKLCGVPMFYSNPDDERWIVPKRIEAMGWTINFAKCCCCRGKTNSPTTVASNATVQPTNDDSNK